MGRVKNKREIAHRKQKQYRELEKEIVKRHRSKREKAATLGNDDFRNGVLSIRGYTNLKSQFESIQHTEDAAIIVPKEYMSGFKTTLDHMVSDELIHVRKDWRNAIFVSIACLVIGIALLGLGAVLRNTYLMYELTLVASWGFVWAAIEKWFFDRARLHRKRLGLLQILSSDIVLTRELHFKDDADKIST